ncbi:MAG: NUDIX hydrolase [Acidimicrobiales bacterium]
MSAPDRPPRLPSMPKWLADPDPDVNRQPGPDPTPAASGAGQALDLARWHLGHAVAGDTSIETARSTMLAFLEAHPDALLRTCAPGHLTSSALVVEAETERVLLLHHTKLRRWLQPGGHVDGAGDLARSALREATEETGMASLRVASPAIDLDIHRVSPPHEPPHDHLDVRFLVMAPAGARPIGNHESTDLRWVPIDELDRYEPDIGLRRLARRGLEMARRLGPPPP